ncbi:hypothetical protein AMTRI_Chr09g33450 [Amborella trichopoda]
MAPTMGRVNFETTITHFSHHHQLLICDLSHQPTPCSCCGLSCTAWAYRCTPCAFALHMTCAQLPQRITHPSHPPHPLSLVSAPPYGEGLFNCDGCSRPGTCFSYHCSNCHFDLHTLCAVKPLTRGHDSHMHPLYLAFAPPPHYRGAFECDLCGGLGGHHWLYRCDGCGFDVHLGCAALEPGAQIQPRTQPLVTQEQKVVCTPPINYGRGAVGHGGGGRVGGGGGGGGGGVGGVGGGLIGSAVNGLVEGVFQHFGQNIAQGLIADTGASSTLTALGGDGGVSDWL